MLKQLLCHIWGALVELRYDAEDVVAIEMALEAAQAVEAELLAEARFEPVRIKRLPHSICECS